MARGGLGQLDEVCGRGTQRREQQEEPAKALLHPGEPVGWSGAGEPRMQASPLAGEENYQAISVS